VSVSSAAVELALQVFGKFKDHTVLIVGAGETSELTATHLKAHGIEKVLVTNRTFAAAEELARRVGGRAVPFEDLEEHLAAADIVISSTSAPHYVITREVVERSLKHRRHRPIFFIDIAVPRDLDPEINRVRNAYLYDIDDLQHVVEQNRGEREKEAHHAERIVDEELHSVNDWLRSLEVVPTIASLRATVEQIRRDELERLSGKLGDLSDEQRAQVDMLTASIVNKILHLPTVKMKEVAGSQECYLYVDAVRTLFDLSGNASAPESGAGVAAGGATQETAAGAAEPPGATVHHLRGTGTDNA
jgi:glutamyl-tRNA reductase